MLVQRLEIAHESLSKIGGRPVTGPLLEKLYGSLELAHGTVELWALCQVFPGHDIFSISLTVPQVFFLLQNGICTFSLEGKLTRVKY